MSTVFRPGSGCCFRSARRPRACSPSPCCRSRATSGARRGRGGRVGRGCGLLVCALDVGVRACVRACVCVCARVSGACVPCVCVSARLRMGVCGRYYEPKAAFLKEWRARWPGACRCNARCNAPNLRCNAPNCVATRRTCVATRRAALQRAELRCNAPSCVARPVATRGGPRLQRGTAPPQHCAARPMQRRRAAEAEEDERAHHVGVADGGESGDGGGSGEGVPPPGNAALEAAAESSGTADGNGHGGSDGMVPPLLGDIEQLYGSPPARPRRPAAGPARV